MRVQLYVWPPTEDTWSDQRDVHDTIIIHLIPEHTDNGSSRKVSGEMRATNTIPTQDKEAFTSTIGD